MWAVKQLGMGAEQAPELLQGTWGGCAGFVHWDHPAPPCFQGCWCHPAAWWQLMLCASSLSSVQLPKGVPKGTAANQRVQHRDPAHTALTGAHLQPSSHGEGLMGGCTGALVHTQPHPALAGSSLLLSSSSTHPWLLAKMFLFPTAPTKGWMQSCLARHKLTTSQAKKQESVWQLDKMYPRSCRKPIDQD